MERCKLCKKKPKLKRRVNCEGLVFCSDDCYEEFDNSPNDMDHPYIDDYDAIRFEYIEWTKSYEQELCNAKSIDGKPIKEELLEGIESVIDEFSDYMRLKGEDGVFSKEIYNYLMELEALQIVIKDWKLEKTIK